MIQIMLLEYAYTVESRQMRLDKRSRDVKRVRGEAVKRPSMS